MPKDIFISYSRKDQKRAFGLAKKLEGEGLSVWLDQERIDGAVLWQKEIVQAIQGARAVILLASKASFSSVNVTREISLAFEENKPILPVFLEETDIPSEFRYQLAGIHRIEIHKSDDKKSWENILNAIRKILQKSRPVKGRKPVAPEPVPTRKGLPMWMKLSAGVLMLFALLVVAKKLKNKQNKTRAQVSSSVMQKPPASRPPLQGGIPDKPASEVNPPVVPTKDEESIPDSIAPEPPADPRFIIGRFKNGREFFRGKVAYPGPGELNFTVQGIKSGIVCTGSGTLPVSNENKQCVGLTGSFSFSCDRGGKVSGQLKPKDCFKGRALGEDSRGHALELRYGLSARELRRAMARPVIKRMLEERKKRNG